MSTQLKLPLGPYRKALEAAREEASFDSFEHLHVELEGLLRRFQDTMIYGPEFIEVWEKAREEACQSYGWTVEGFYAELASRKRS